MLGLDLLISLSFYANELQPFFPYVWNAMTVGCIYTQNSFLQQIYSINCLQSTIMQPCCCNATCLGKCPNFICGRIANSEKFLCLLLYLEVFLQIYKKCIIYNVSISFKIPWGKIYIFYLVEYIALHTSFNLYTSAQNNSRIGMVKH